MSKIDLLCYVCFELRSGSKTSNCAMKIRESETAVSAIQLSTCVLHSFRWFERSRWR